MTDKIIGDAIIEILKEQGIPLTEKEIEKNLKSLKTVNKVLPMTDELISEYKAIQRKESRLSKNQRDAVNIRIEFLLNRKVITQQQIA